MGGARRDGGLRLIDIRRDVVHRDLWVIDKADRHWPVHGTPGRNGKLRAFQDHGAQFRNGDPLSWVALEDAAQDTDHLIGQRKNGLEKVRILQVGPECGILGRGTLPGVAATGQVDQDYAQTPDIIGSGFIP